MYFVVLTEFDLYGELVWIPTGSTETPIIDLSSDSNIINLSSTDKFIIGVGKDLIEGYSPKLIPKINSQN